MRTSDFCLRRGASQPLYRTIEDSHRRVEAEVAAVGEVFRLGGFQGHLVLGEAAVADPELMDLELG
jgi:hypothetical protein